MESRCKQQHKRTRLNLDLWLPIKDVRKLIYEKLTKLDREMVKAAHDSREGEYESLDGGYFVYQCAKQGYLSLLQYMLKDVNRIEAIAGNGAAEGGHLHVLQWLMSVWCDWDMHLCNYAASNGHLHVIKWVVDAGHPHDIDGICDNAARTGHLHVLQWVKDAGYELSRDTCYTAARFGHLNVLKWGIEAGCIMHSYGIPVARKFPEIVAYLETLGDT